MTTGQLEHVDKEEQSNPHNVYKVPIPAGSFKAKAIFRGEMPLNCPEELDQQHEGTKRHVKSVKAG